MKKFIIFVVIVIGGMIWLKDWITSGKMDAYIAAHPDPKVTPQVLLGLGEFYFTVQDHKSAAYYYRWILDSYPKTPRKARVHWQLGRSYEEIGKRGEAIEQYAILKDSYSATSYGELGHARYGQLKY